MVCMAALVPELTLYSSTDCCLCAELKRQLEGLSAEIGFGLVEIDIAGNPELERRYRLEIPVLLINGRKAVKYRIGTEALRQRLLHASGRGWRGIRRLR